jgi:hypothetical protein
MIITPKSGIHNLNIFATMTKFESCKHVFSHVYDYMIKLCYETHNFVTKAHGLTSKPCLIKWQNVLDTLRNWKYFI